MKVLHSTASKFGKLSSGHRTGKGQFFIPIPKKDNAKNCGKVTSKCPQEEIVIEKVQAWRDLVSPRVTRKTQKGQHLGSYGEVRSTETFSQHAPL